MNAFISYKARGLMMLTEIFADYGSKRGSIQIRLKDTQLLGGSFLRLRFYLCPTCFHRS